MTSAPRTSLKLTKIPYNQGLLIPTASSIGVIPKKAFHPIHYTQIIPKEPEWHSDLSVETREKITLPWYNDGVEEEDIEPTTQKITRKPIICGWKWRQMIKLQMTGNMDMEFEAQLELLLKLAKLGCLKTLDLTIRELTLTDKNVENLALSIFRGLPHLTHLTLNFVACEMAPDCLRILKSISTQGYNKLKKLSVHFDMCDGLAPDSLTVFKICPSKFYDLNLELLNCFEGSTNARRLGFETTTSSSKLKRLIITCYETISIQDKTFLGHLPYPIKGHKELQSLDFAITHPQHCSNDKAMTKIGQEISERFEDLHQLSISLKLKSSSIEPNKKATDNGVEALITSLTKFTQLKQLKLDLGWYGYATDKALNSLRTQICQHFKDLESLTLAIEGWEKITDTAAKNLVDEVCKNLSHLKYLSIEFKNCANLSSDDLETIKNKVSTFLSQVSKQ